MCVFPKLHGIYKAKLLMIKYESPGLSVNDIRTLNYIGLVYGL